MTTEQRDPEAFRKRFAEADRKLLRAFVRLLNADASRPPTNYPPDEFRRALLDLCAEAEQRHVLRHCAIREAEIDIRPIRIVKLPGGAETIDYDEEPR